MMKVTLLAHSALTPEAYEIFNEKKRKDQFNGTSIERLTEIAGRTCYDSFGKGRSSVDYHKHIIDVGHGSVLEHGTVTVLIEGVSRGLTHELIRHRVGTAVSQRSTRYVDEDESEVIIHPLLKEMLESGVDKFNLTKEKIDQCWLDNRSLYRHIVNSLEGYLTNKGEDKFTARKQARGAARGFLENGMETELIFTMNMRAMLNIISQRAVGAADAEIRELAVEFLKIGKQVAPAYFKRIKVKDGCITTKKVRI
jgi:thymidylate synthase (FAD)